MLSPRDISKMEIDKGNTSLYAYNHSGVLINDPVLLKIDEDCYWFSIADSDIWTWASAINYERQLNVDISEPDVAPLAIQGPKSEDLAAEICAAIG